MFILIRYAIHEFDIMSCDVFNTYEAAKRKMQDEIDFFFDEEMKNTPFEERGKIICTDCDEDNVGLCSADKSRHWTWHIVDPMNQ